MANPPWLTAGGSSGLQFVFLLCYLAAAYFLHWRTERWMVQALERQSSRLTSHELLLRAAVREELDLQRRVTPPCCSCCPRPRPRAKTYSSRRHHNITQDPLYWSYPPSSVDFTLPRREEEGGVSGVVGDGTGSQEKEARVSIVSAAGALLPTSSSVTTEHVVLFHASE